MGCPQAMGVDSGEDGQREQEMLEVSLSRGLLRRGRGSWWRCSWFLGEFIPEQGRGGTRSWRNPLVEQRAADEEMDRRGAAPGGAAAGASQEPGEEWGVTASPAAGQSGGR